VVTFAVIGHNEEELLATAIAQAVEAARSGDRVWFVDSASTDGSAALARSLGVEVLAAPLGKGRAMSEVLRRCATGRVCFVDADIETSSVNIPLTLRDAIEASDADMVVGDFDWPRKRFSGAKVGIYRPLVADLFPEALDIAPRMPFSGFRILDAALDIGVLPPRWGSETYLNVHLIATGRRVTTVDLGEYDGPMRLKTAELGADAAEAILELAEREGRLDAAMRPRWEAWVARAMTVLSTQPDSHEPDGDYASRLAEVPTWPRPSARAPVAHR
jgi:glycosyltransferase involved in cell wall biosynthesis